MMGWFSRHLNITWVILTLLQFTTIWYDSPIPFLITRVLWIVGTFWVLHRKDRSWLWFIIPISVLFLSNKRTGENTNTFTIWGEGDGARLISTEYNIKELREMLSCPTCSYFNQKDVGGHDSRTQCAQRS